MLINSENGFFMVSLAHCFHRHTYCIYKIRMCIALITQSYLRTMLLLRKSKRNVAKYFTSRNLINAFHTKKIRVNTLLRNAYLR